MLVEDAAVFDVEVVVCKEVCETRLTEEVLVVGLPAAVVPLEFAVSEPVIEEGRAEDVVELVDVIRSSPKLSTMTKLSLENEFPLISTS